MTRLALLASLLLFTSCSQDRLVGRPEDCPRGCYDAVGRCVDGRNEAACGTSGLACSDCGATDTCVEQVCKNLHAVPTITWAPGFESLGEKPLAADITRLTTLQPEETDRATATPTLYGLRTASQDIVSLGTWDTFGTTATVAAAVAPWDEGHPDITFLDVFAGNRRLLMTGYLLNGVYRLHLHSTQPVDRPVGTTVEQVAGPFAVTPIGDFFFLSAPGVMTVRGAGIYGLLDGPSINSTRGVAAYTPASSAGVGLMATAHHNVGLFGARDTLTGEQRLSACTLAAYMDAYTAAANHPWSLNLQSCAQVYSGGSELVALARMADGFAVLERTPTAQTLRFVPLTVTGTGASQTVTAGAAVLMAEVDPSASVETLTDYGDDLLVVVRNASNRMAHRVARRTH